MNRILLYDDSPLVYTSSWDICGVDMLFDVTNLTVIVLDMSKVSALSYVAEAFLFSLWSPEEWLAGVVVG